MFKTYNGGGRTRRIRVLLGGGDHYMALLGPEDRLKTLIKSKQDMHLFKNVNRPLVRVD